MFVFIKAESGQGAIVLILQLTVNINIVVDLFGIVPMLIVTVNYETVNAKNSMTDYYTQACPTVQAAFIQPLLKVLLSPKVRCSYWRSG